MTLKVGDIVELKPDTPLAGIQLCITRLPGEGEVWEGEVIKTCGHYDYPVGYKEFGFTPDEVFLVPQTPFDRAVRAYIDRELHAP